MKLNVQAAELAMAEHGYGKNELAEAMDVSRQTVYWYFAGNAIKPKMAKRFADALAVPVRDIIDEEPMEGQPEKGGADGRAEL